MAFSVEIIAVMMEAADSSETSVRFVPEFCPVSIIFRKNKM
jgi:hypothetical protein